MTAPQIGQVRIAETIGGGKKVRIEVTYIESEGPDGWNVYGYRQGVRRGPNQAVFRQTMYPRLYFIAKTTQR